MMRSGSCRGRNCRLLQDKLGGKNGFSRIESGLRRLLYQFRSSDVIHP